MLLGQYIHSIDPKGRFNFPAKFREDLGESFIITKGLDDKACLFAYPMEKWEALTQKIDALPIAKARNIQRFLFANASQVTVDKQGRVLLPSYLKDYAGLENELMVIGSSNHAEIWNPERWNRINEEMTGEKIFTELIDIDF